MLEGCPPTRGSDEGGVDASQLLALVGEEDARLPQPRSWSKWRVSAKLAVAQPPVRTWRRMASLPAVSASDAASPSWLSTAPGWEVRVCRCSFLVLSKTRPHMVPVPGLTSISQMRVLVGDRIAMGRRAWSLSPTLTSGRRRPAASASACRAGSQPWFWLVMGPWWCPNWEGLMALATDGLMKSAAEGRGRPGAGAGAGAATTAAERAPGVTPGTPGAAPPAPTPETTAETAGTLVDMVIR